MIGNGDMKRGYDGEGGFPEVDKESVVVIEEDHICQSREKGKGQRKSRFSDVKKVLKSKLGRGKHSISGHESDHSCSSPDTAVARVGSLVDSQEL